MPDYLSAVALHMQIDVEHLVMNAIYTEFPTRKVEQNLELTARLEQDLGLNRKDVIWLGLSIEKELAYEPGTFFFTDQQILGWKTVQDIIDTIEAAITS